MPENLPAKRDLFYDAHLPTTLSECVVLAGEQDQSAKAEIALLRGMLTKLLKSHKDCDMELNDEANTKVLELVREIRATLKVQSDMSAKEKGMLHPSAIGIFASMIIQILNRVLPDPEQLKTVQAEVMNTVSRLPIKDMQRG